MSFHDVCLLLRETREQHGLSLDEVAQRTYIKLLYLQALEAGEQERLPAPVYTYGYIRKVAKLLGLDGDALVAQLQDGGTRTSLVPQRSQAPMAELPAEAFNRIKATITGPERPGRRSERAPWSSIAEDDPADIRQAKLQADQIISAAEREAQQMIRGAEQYAQDVLANLEMEVAKALSIIQNGRQFLHARRQGGYNSAAS